LMGPVDALPAAEAFASGSAMFVLAGTVVAVLVAHFQKFQAVGERGNESEQANHRSQRLE
jgi:hypothetical protein